MNGRGSTAELIVDLTDLALVAPGVPQAVTPILNRLVERTAAVGAAYFELGQAGGFYHARAASGEMPAGPTMDELLAHGLPAETPLLQALRRAPGPLFFDDTASTPETAGFPDLGVTSMAAAPVRDARRTLLGAFLMHTFIPHQWTGGEADLVAAVSGTLAALAARLVAEERAAAAQERAIHALGLALEYRDRETKGHTDRVTDRAVGVARALGLSEEEIEPLRWGAYLHDVGKIGIPDSILLKPGSFDASEWELMQSHSAIGHAFAEKLEFLPAGALAVVRSHHERWDGLGYPDGLAGESIPLLARIFAVADVYDALISPRPYKPAWTHEAAVAEIRAQSGKQFDPVVVAAFLAPEEGRA